MVAETKSIPAVSSKPATNRAKNRAILLSGLAFVFFGGGFFSPLLGLIFIIIHSAIAHDQVFNQIGTALMIVSIPMLLIGSHFLDLIERKK